MVLPFSATAALAVVDAISRAPSGRNALILEELRGGARVAAVAIPCLSPRHRSPSHLYHRVSTQFYDHWPEPLRFFVSGNVGNVIFFSLERLLHSLLNHNLKRLPALLIEYKDGASFMMAYFLHILAQHWLHAFLVYGMHTISTPQKYLKTLIGCYSTYMGAMVGSTILNSKLIKWGFSRTLAFVLTVWTFACFNFFILKFLHTIGAEPTQLADSPVKTTNPTNIGKDATRPRSNISTLEPTTLLRRMRGGDDGSLFSVVAGGNRSIHDFVCSVGVPIKIQDS
ncbi:hypothetical protein MHU86_6423 [Fragilaria crotonensis]|nr:hypothetical protein MHU86_6423 [Fragilaria crotonensis]